MRHVYSSVYLCIFQPWNSYCNDIYIWLNQTENNELTGIISPEVADLWKLRYLDLGKTFQIWPFHAKMNTWKLMKLNFFYKGNNNFNGGLPNYLNQLSDLRHLNIGTKILRNDNLISISLEIFTLIFIFFISSCF